MKVFLEGVNGNRYNPFGNNDTPLDADMNYVNKVTNQNDPLFRLGDTGKCAHHSTLRYPTIRDAETGEVIS